MAQLTQTPPATAHVAPATAHTALAHHFDNLEQQREAGTLGMWVFLMTEVMFFGGLFTAYIIYRFRFYPEAFAVGSNHLDWRLGAFNTAVLIASSLTMALAVWASQVGRSRRTQIIFLLVTMALGTTFLVVKVIEYRDKYLHHLVPIKGWFNPDPATFHIPDNVSVSSVEMFYFIYFAMTGVHALHMIIGIGILSFLVYFASRGRYTPEYHAPVELSGLYWHFVDIVWIFLFPLLYLLGAHYGKH